MRAQEPVGHSDEMFAGLDPETGRWRHLFPSRVGVRMSGEEPENIHRVRVTIDPEGPLWGWWYSELDPHFGGRITFVYPVRGLVEMCFPDAARSEERGHGLIVRVRVERLD